MSCLFCPLWMWNDLTNSLYISVTHNSLTFPTLSSFWALHWKSDFIFSSWKHRTLNLQPSTMASSSTRQETGSSASGLHIDTRSSYMIKPKTMATPFECFEVQVESPVDFASLKSNGMNLDSLMAAQQLFAYFSMLNGPTYVKLVKDFWVWAVMSKTASVRFYRSSKKRVSFQQGVV